MTLGRLRSVSPDAWVAGTLALMGLAFFIAMVVVAG